MTEQKVKKREWVKNAAIIFLAVMLALTFFSNTIMNRSLPEVATQSVQSTSINAKIRGVGTVTAIESYEVKTEQTREVLSVPVQVGDKVEVGDMLLLFADAESSQIKEAQDALDALVLAYQKALINTTDSDYSKESRDIRLAQQALDKSKAERDANVFSASDLANAKANVNRTKHEIATQQTKVDALQDKLSGMSPGSDNSQIYAAINSKNSELNAAKQDLNAAKKAYSTPYGKLEEYANEWKTKSGDTQKSDSFYIRAIGDSFSDQVAANKDPMVLPYEGSTIPATNLENAKKIVEAYKAIRVYEDKISTLESEIRSLQSQINTGDPNYESVKKQLSEAKNSLIIMQSFLSSYENTLKELEEKKEKYDTAVQAVDTNQRNLEDLMFALAEKKKSDGKTKATESLDLDAQRKQIEKKRDELANLKAGGDGAAIESNVNGIVTSINVTAGNNTQADSVLMVIEVPDRGYGLSIPVTIEQSKKVQMGETAEITNYYYGNQITATLSGIKPDKDNPSTKKLLFFNIKGEIESGTQLAVSIGEKGGNYETVVPNSAVRTDSNGSFVLVIEAKSSPLGNRYVAQRVDVKVLASDDVNSAVSGGISRNDIIITTSNKPIEPGMLVRLPDK